MTNAFPPAQIAAANKASVAAILFVSKSAFAGAERLAALNLNTVRSLIDDVSGEAKSLFATKDVFAVPSAIVRPLTERAVSWTRSLYEIATQSGEEVSSLIDSQVGEFQKHVAGALDKAARHAPVGLDLAIAAVKSVVALRIRPTAT